MIKYIASLIKIKVSHNVHILVIIRNYATTNRVFQILHNVFHHS